MPHRPAQVTSQTAAKAQKRPVTLLSDDDYDDIDVCSSCYVQEGGSAVDPESLCLPIVDPVLLGYWPPIFST